MSIITIFMFCSLMFCSLMFCSLDIVKSTIDGEGSIWIRQQDESWKMQ